MSRPLHPLVLHSSVVAVLAIAWVADWFTFVNDTASQFTIYGALAMIIPLVLFVYIAILIYMAQSRTRGTVGRQILIGILSILISFIVVGMFTGAVISTTPVADISAQ